MTPAAQWDDPIVDRAPMEQTASVSAGVVFGPTGLANTRAQLGLTPTPNRRSGWGVSAATQLNAVFVAHTSVGASISGATVDLFFWSGSRSGGNTSSAVYVGGTIPTGGNTFFVRSNDVRAGLHSGYAGYFDVLPFMDVSIDGVLGLGTPLSGVLVYGAADVTLFLSPDKARWVALAGADASVSTVTLQVGYRRRLGALVELGAAAVVPVYTAEAMDGEVPLWPVVDLRVRGAGGRRTARAGPAGPR